MYNTFANSEAEFASAYLTYKLGHGGVPSVNQKELLGAAIAFTNNPLYAEQFPKLQKFTFEDMNAVGEDLQDRISAENETKRPAIVRDGKRLLPTYDFQDVGDLVNANSFNNFLRGHKFYKTNVSNRVVKVAPQYQTNAAAGAQYLTEFLTEKYQAYVLEHGRALITTVGSQTQAEKEFFHGFNQAATYFLGSLMTDNEGVAQISSQPRGNLAFNNWHRLLAGFPVLQQFTRDVEVHGKEFTMKLTPDSVQVEETQFMPHEVAQEQADGCRHTHIDLLSKFTQQSTNGTQTGNKLRVCQLGNSQLLREVNERLRPW